MKNTEGIEVHPDRWMDLKEAVEEAQNMVSTIVLTIVFTVSKIKTYVIDVHGINQMVILVKDLDKSKSQKKIKNYIINNLTTYPPIDVPTLKKLIKENYDK